MNCEACNKQLDECRANNIKCGFRECRNWTHKICMNKSQVSKSGFYYCKVHIKDIPPELVPIIPNVENTDKNKDTVKEFESESAKDVNPEKKRDSDVIVVESEKEKPRNPFEHFNCDKCHKKFENSMLGIICIKCRSIFHESCLSIEEVNDAKKAQFICQSCTRSIIDIEKLKIRQREDMKAKKVEKPKEVVHVLSSTRKDSKCKQKFVDLCSSSSVSSDSDSINSDNNLKYQKKFAKYKKLKKKFKNLKIDSHSDSDSSDNDFECMNDESSVSSENAVLSLYKLTKEERQRSKFEKLPIVEHADTKWSVFFDLFKKSRKLFSHSENILRIQNAIKCKEIIDIGGYNLFDPKTYWNSLKLINERLCHAHNLLQRETNEIIKLKKLNHESAPKKIIEFINKIINYCCIVEKYGSKKHKVDERVISHIGNIMPNNLATGWYKTRSKLESCKKDVKIKHVSEYLANQVPHLTLKIQSEEIDPWKDINPNRFMHNAKRTYSTNYDSDSFDSNTYCWLHNSKSHSAFECNQLWDLSGKEVSELARKRNICTYCGFKRHRNCHIDEELACTIEGCNFKHNVLFCYRRKGNKDHNRRSSTLNNSSDDSDDEKSNPVDERHNFHKNDDHEQQSDKSQSEDSEIDVPESNFHINNPQKIIKVKSSKKNNNSANHSKNNNKQK